MVRILLLIPFLLWMVFASQPPPASATTTAPPRVDPRLVALFLGGFVALVVAMRVWSMRLTRRIEGRGAVRNLRRFGMAMFIARIVVAAWYAVGLYLLGWGNLVVSYCFAPNDWPVMLPATVVAVAPAFLAWMGLWWSHYPADRALREQTLLDQLEADLPVHAPPTFAAYFVAQLQLQLVFTVLPLLLILAARDVAFCALRLIGIRLAAGSNAEAAVMLAAAVAVFLLAPEVLRRVMRTRPLPDSPLRQRLEAMCRRVRLRYRDILLWHTDNNMGNAAVMGLVPWVRFIWLSDLLLETMTDEQIEAVFAHEVGHIVHRHMAWYVVLVIVVMLFVSWLDAFLGGHLSALGVPRWLRENAGLMLEIGSTIGFFVTFGFVSRRFERQADVYAARTMQRQVETARAARVAAPMPAPAPEPEPEPMLTPSYVGEYGAGIFNSALRRVAAMNHIPMSEPPRLTVGDWRQRAVAVLDRMAGIAGNWLHGSVASRMQYLTHLSTDPQRTARFDRRMLGVYLSLMAALVLAVAAVWTLRREVFGM